MIIWIDFVGYEESEKYWIDQQFDTIEELADYVFSREVLIAQYQSAYAHQDGRKKQNAIAVDKITKVWAEF